MNNTVILSSDACLGHVPGLKTSAVSLLSDRCTGSVDGA